MVTPIKPNPSVSVTDKDGKPQRDWINYWSNIADTVDAITVPTAANPTGTIGLATVNGSAVTFLRSDGAPALSQAIAPSWTATHNFALGLRFSAAQAAGSIVGADTFSATNGINFNLVTFSDNAWMSTAARIYGNGDAAFGVGNPPIDSGALVRDATLEAFRRPSYTTYSGGSGVRSALRATTYIEAGVQSNEWAILGITEDYGNASSGVAVYGQANKYASTGSSQSCWGGCFEMHARAQAENPSGSEIGCEISMSGTGTDNNQKRTGLLIASFTDTGATYHLYAGIQFIAEGSNAIVDKGIIFSSSVSSVGDVLDTASATVTGKVLRMAAAQKITFNSGSDVGLYYDAGSVGLRYDTTGGGYSYVFHNNGTIDAAAFTVVSDLRYKRNIEPLTGGLAIIEKLQPRWFEALNGQAWSHNSGFIADDLEDVLPDVVTTGPDGIKRVDYSRTPNAAVVSAIQELSARVAALEGR
jgi:hypothetical protein